MVKITQAINKAVLVQQIAKLYNSFFMEYKTFPVYYAVCLQKHLKLVNIQSVSAKKQAVCQVIS